MSTLDFCWIHQGHALYLRPASGRQTRWEVYYRPFPFPRTNRDLRALKKEILADHADRAEARRFGEAAVDAGEVETPPDAAQTRAIAESLDRETGIAGFVSPEDLPQLDVVPFRYDPTWPPLPEDGLQIGRDDAGTWRTYQERYPGSTLTSGHVGNVEAYWACHALRKLAAWATTVDVRTDGGDDEPQRCRDGRESLADRVDTVGERFAEWRAPVEAAPEAVREIRGVTDLRLARFGRGDWSVIRTIDGRSLLNKVGSQAKATAVARAMVALGDVATVPPYVLPHLPALRADAEAIKWEAGSHPDASRWAEESRARAAERRRKVVEAVEAERKRRRGW